MKNMMKKFLAMFAALAVMVSVVMPVFETRAATGSSGPEADCWERWDDGSNRD